MRYMVSTSLFRVTVIVLLLMSIILLPACTKTDAIGPVTNLDVINFVEFSLDATEVGQTTMVEGTVFVHGDLDKPEDIIVRIVAFIEIDPVDWGGVGLNFPEGWRITSVDSGLVEIDEPYCSNLVSVMSSRQPEDGGKSWVYAGYPITRPGDSSGDLSGAVVIEAEYVWEGKSTPETLKLTVGVGSKDDYIVNPVSIDLEVPLIEDFRPIRVKHYFPRQKQPFELEMTHSTQIQGELVLEDGLLRVDGYLVIWPFEYFGWADTGTVLIKDGDSGATVARVGDILTIPGYEVSAQEAGLECVGATFFKEFPGPYWLAYLVNTQQ